MKSQHNNYEALVASSRSVEKKWYERKKSILSKFSVNINREISKEDLVRERNNQKAEIEKLENDNLELSRKLSELQQDITEANDECQRANRESDSQKKEMVKLLTEESSLVNEMEFYISEKMELEETLANISEKLESRIKTLDRSAKDIGFIKGEAGVLIDKMTILENDIPEKHSNVEGIDELMTGTMKALKQLYKRMQKVEIGSKAGYYNKKLK